MSRRPYLEEMERQEREFTDSEWGRLDDLAIEGLRERVKRESHDALEELRRRNLEVPDANHR